jgi:hypothetical protein
MVNSWKKKEVTGEIGEQFIVQKTAEKTTGD